jgi:ATP-dependent Lon protease
MTSFIKNINKEEALEGRYHDLSILPLRNSVAYPFSVIPLLVGVPRSVRLIEEAMKGEGIIGLVASKDGRGGATADRPEVLSAKIDRVSRVRKFLEVVVRCLNVFE